TAHLFGVIGVALHDLGPADSRVERCAELVGDHCHEFVFASVGLLRFAAGCALSFEQAPAFGHRLAPLGLQAAAIGDVAEHEDHAPDAPVGTYDGHTAVVDGMLGAVCGDEQRAIGQTGDGSDAEHAGHGAVDRLARALAYDTENLG